VLITNRNISDGTFGSEDASTRVVSNEKRVRTSPLHGNLGTAARTARRLATVRVGNEHIACVSGILASSKQRHLRGEICGGAAGSFERDRTRCAAGRRRRTKRPIVTHRFQTASG